MTTERDLELSIAMVNARRLWLASLSPSLPASLPHLAFGFAAGYKAALEDHGDCHPVDDVDMCQEAVKAASREWR